MMWTDAHDVLFVREVLLFEPYQHRKGSVERKQVWEQLAVSLNANVDLIIRKICTRPFKHYSRKI